MARYLSSLAVLATLWLITGCAQQPPAAESRLPMPTLEGPVVLAPPAPSLPATQPITPLPVKPKTPAAEVPPEWNPAGPTHNWQWIVVHHSATPNGCASAFDREHRNKGWDELGYHFVIGNGTLTRDGQIEVGSRWPKQKWGAHAKTADQQFNNFGIGICLVGNFEVERPSQAQLQSLARLTAYLMSTYHIPADRVIGHGQTKPTDCPGRNCSVGEIRRLAMQTAQREGWVIIPSRSIQAGELLRDADDRR